MSNDNKKKISARFIKGLFSYLMPLLRWQLLQFKTFNQCANSILYIWFCRVWNLHIPFKVKFDKFQCSTILSVSINHWPFYSVATCFSTTKRCKLFESTKEMPAPKQTHDKSIDTTAQHSSQINHTVIVYLNLKWKKTGVFIVRIEHDLLMAFYHIFFFSS